MTRRTRQVFLLVTTLLTAGMLVLVLLSPRKLADPKPPDSIEGKAAWLASHPADWLTASALADAALDATEPGRFELWRASYAHAKRLAPFRANPDAAFLRAGFFHWYELTPPDRTAVLRVAAPMMRNPAFFGRMYTSVLQLTHDFGWLRRNSPDTEGARATLRNLAVERGLFSDYRALREEMRQERLRSFNAQRASLDPSVILELLPDRVDTGDEPLVRGILEELERKAFDPEHMHPKIETLVDYAVDHDVQPLHGLLPILDTPSKLRDVTRARTALELNNPALATRIEITTGVNGAAEWEPYYLDRARFEARRHDAGATNTYLVRASMSGITDSVLAAGEETARLLGNGRAAEEYRTQLLDRAAQPRTWTGTCGTNELCASASFDAYVSGEALPLTFETTQSDEIAPYVEIYVDDTLKAEGDVGGQRAFAVNASPGLHHVEVRLVNPRTRNGIQRRVRLS